ncbi:MAG TPA: hypothetical protein VF049_00020, partial [Nocardioidaceae bacterium]
DAARAAVTHKERLLIKYRDDYEADLLDAGTYTERTRELKGELSAAKARVTELEQQIGVAATAPAPTDADRAALHLLLAERIHTGPVPVRKALFTALVERLEVHAADDVRPTFRLGGPTLIGDEIDQSSEENPSDSDAELASGRQMFAYRHSGWS